MFSDAIVVRKTTIIKIKTAANFIPGTVLSAFSAFLLNHGYSPRSWVTIVIIFFQVRLLLKLEEPKESTQVAQGGRARIYPRVPWP